MDVVLPAEHDGRHALVLPSGADVRVLALAWFEGAGWEREPVAPQQAVSRPMTGARFRGMVVEDAVPGSPGVLRLTEQTALRGPFPLDDVTARAAGMRTDGPFELFDIEGGEESRVRSWCVAAARRAGGVVVPAQRTAIVPEADGPVDLTLWSPIPLSPADVVPLVRPAMTGARVTAGDVPPRVPGGPVTCEMTARFEYDGVVVLRTERSEQVPVVLAGLEWREYGPWAYRVTWRVPDEQAGTSLEGIARQRVAPTVARVVAALWRAAGGTVVDAGGFVVTPDELTRRAVASR